MKKNISINLQGLIFHIEDDGYEVLSRYLQEVKAHFASYQGHEEIVVDIEGRIAELFAARLSVSKQVITLADVEEMTAKMGRVRDFATEPDEEEAAYAEPAAAGAAYGRAAGPTPPFGGQAADGQPRRLYRDLAHRKIAGVCAGLAQYFMVNPLWIRVGFLVAVFFKLFFNTLSLGRIHLGNNIDIGGLAIIAYVILWIVLPKRDDAPEPIDTLDFGGKLTGRKLFRDTDTGKVGGVAAGLAAYFQTDVVLVRVLFLLSLLLGGSGLIAYLILWTVVPEARTVSEKMQMRGDAITLSGIDNNLRTGSGVLEGPSPAGSRSVGTFLEGAARGAKPAVSFLGTIIRWVAAIILILIGGSSLLSVLGFAGAALGVISSESVIHTNSNSFPFGEESFNSVMHNTQPWSIVAATLLAGIPFLALILLGIRLVLRRSVLSRTASLSLLALWLLGLVGTTAAGGQIIRDTRRRASYTTVRRLARVPGPGIVLASRNMDDFMEEANLHLALADSGAAPYVEEDYQARGRTQDAARLTAQQSILYNITQEDSTITFDQGITLRENMPYRGQRLSLTLHLPLDKVYRLTPLFIEKLRDEDFTNRNRPHDDQEHRAHFTRQRKFTCLDCPSTGREEEGNNDDQTSINSYDEDGDEVVDLGVNGTKMRVRVNTDGDQPDIRISTEAPKFNTDLSHYGTGRKNLPVPGEFSEIETHGAFRVLVRQGDSYHVEAAGRPEDLDQMGLRVEGDRLVVRHRDRGFLSGFNFSSHTILVTVTLPRLQKLELNGACQADVSGFRDQSLGLDVSGASFARLRVDVPNLDVNLSGASHADLSGSANNLTIDGSSASQVEGLGLRTENTTLKLSGASQAAVRASNGLTADLSGSSRARYAGKPAHIEKDLSGNSSLEEVRD